MLPSDLILEQMQKNVDAFEGEFQFQCGAGQI